MAQVEQITPFSQKKKNETAHHNKRFFSAENPFFWLLPGLGILIVYAIFPLIANIFLSFNEWNIMTKEFQSVGGENWSTIFNSLITSNPVDPRIQNSLIVTFEYVVIALFFQLVLGFAIALLLDARPYGAALMQTLMIMPMVIAPAVAGMMARLLMHSEFGAVSWLLYSLNILDPAEPLMGGTGRYALVAILIVDIWQWTSFFVIIILAGLKGLSPEIIEASEVDGANWFQRLIYVKIPLLRGVLLVAVLFRLVDLYRVFDYIVIMTSGGPGGATEALSFYGYVNTFQLLKWGYGAAISLVIVIIAWVTAYLYQRFFRITW